MMNSVEEGRRIRRDIDEKIDQRTEASSESERQVLDEMLSETQENP